MRLDIGCIHTQLLWGYPTLSAPCSSCPCSNLALWTGMRHLRVRVLWSLRCTAQCPSHPPTQCSAVQCTENPPCLEQEPLPCSQSAFKGLSPPVWHTNKNLIFKYSALIQWSTRLLPADLQLNPDVAYSTRTILSPWNFIFCKQHRAASGSHQSPRKTEVAHAQTLSATQTGRGFSPKITQTLQWHIQS